MRVLAVVVLALAVAASAVAAAPIRATLTTSSGTAVVGQPWRYTVTARSATGKPLPAKMKLQLLVGATVVGCWKGGEMVQCFDPAAGEWIAFRGKRSGVLRFPAQALGAELTFRATVQAQRQVRRLRAVVTVKAAP